MNMAEKNCDNKCYECTNEAKANCTYWRVHERLLKQIHADNKKDWHEKGSDVPIKSAPKEELAKQIRDIHMNVPSFF
jgi:hypothetical protein